MGKVLTITAVQTLLVTENYYKSTDSAVEFLQKKQAKEKVIIHYNM